MCVVLSNVSKVLKLIKGAKGNVGLILRLIFGFCSNLKKGKQKKIAQKYASDGKAFSSLGRLKYLPYLIVFQAYVERDSQIIFKVSERNLTSER